ncbi:MAG: DNA mismatch repair protein MutL [Deltaproteobacteria bacterium]|nr:DNA mismatch repair protein MutL [Deltaproteobacteria bacterium]
MTKSRQKTPEVPETRPQRGEKGEIRLLSDALVDQIAAGEVVERPASVVKELVENSLDAAAGRIRVEVRDGGAALIAVTDDGLGMTPAELPLALQRHATSKLSSAADLMRISSFGFRGEALPAIASVSRFRILSRARGQERAYQIECEAGRIVSEREAGGAEGTRIEVADLFGSVPARRKFLKRPGTEWGHIADWLARLALVRPDIHIESQRDDRAATVWPACRAARDRIAMILSDEDAAALIEVDETAPGLRIHAFVSTPERTRPNAQGLYLFVNGRPVRDRLLRHALIESYRDLLPRGRFPIAVLYLEIAPDAVDVNVHPAKWEVRFSDPQAIHRAIRHAIRSAMASRSWLVGTGPGASAQTPADAASPAGQLAGSSSPRTKGSASAASGHATRDSASTDDWIFAGGSDKADRVADRTSETAAFGESDRTETEPPPVASFGSLRILGQLRASYLLAESDDGLMVVDQHAAHERILYEALRKGWLEQGVARQALLAAVTVELSATAVAALEQAGELALRLGFEIESFGEGAVLVRAIPAEVAGQDVGELVGELAGALEEVERGDDAGESAIRWLPSLDRLFATMACHAARRFGDRLPEAEQQAILSGLDTIPWAPTCPHGRPVAILIQHEDLELRFRRR